MAAEVSVLMAQVGSTADPALSQRRVAEALALAEADLVVFPEASAVDFGPVGARMGGVAQSIEGPFVSGLVEAAGERTIVAGFFETSPDPHRPFNTVVAVNGQGLIAAYRKIHLYDSFGYQESQAFLPGEIEQRPHFEVGGLMFGVITCYDLRFPELARAQAGEVDAFLVPAAWAAGPNKVRHWHTLLAARAIENVCYVVGVGQPGPKYVGQSATFDPQGVQVAHIAHDQTELLATSCQRSVVAQARARNPSLENRRLAP